jgi:type IV pilus assembly protein PilQ
VLVLESGERTRLILNLVKLVPYETRVDGNSLFLTVGQDADAEYYKQESDPNTLKTRDRAGGRRAQPSIRTCSSSAPPRRRPPDPAAHRSLRGRERVQRAGDVKVEFLDTDIPERSCAATTSRISRRR